MQLSLNLNEINILFSTRKVNAHIGSTFFLTEKMWEQNDIEKEW